MVQQAINAFSPAASPLSRFFSLVISLPLSLSLSLQILLPSPRYLSYPGSRNQATRLPGLHHNRKLSSFSMHEHARNKANRNPVRLWIIEDRYRNENQHEIPRGGDFFGRRNFVRYVIKGGSKRRIFFFFFFFFFFFREVYASPCSFFLFFLGEEYILNFISYPVNVERSFLSLFFNVSSQIN